LERLKRLLASEEAVMKVIRQILAVGNTLGVTLPPELLRAYELHWQALVIIRPTREGILVQPVEVISPLSPRTSEVMERAIVRRYARVADAVEGVGEEKKRIRRTLI